MPRFVQFIAITALALGAPRAAADTIQDFVQCSQVASKEVRLACYDAAAAALKNTTPAASAAPTTQAAPAAAAQSGMVQAAPPVAAPQIAPPPAAKAKGFRFPTFGLFGSKKKQPASAVAPVQSAASDVTAPPAPAAPAASTSEFGADRLPRSEQADGPRMPASIRAGVAEYSYTPYDRIIVFLDNGQAWRQLDGDSTKLRLRKGGIYTAEIKKGALGAYLLSVDGIKKMVKVTRIK